MPALKNQKHELFAQAKSRGVGQTQAAQVSGYKGIGVSVRATELMKRVDIQSRIAELNENIGQQAAIIIAYKLANAIAEADEALSLARENGNAAQMVAAVTLKARLAGLLIDRKAVEFTSVSELSDTELDALIASSNEPVGMSH